MGRLPHIRWGAFALASLVGAALAAVVGPAPAAAAETVLRDCSKIEQPPIVSRPRHIACGAVGAPDFTRLRWTGWARSAANARGRVTYRGDDCSVGCADPSNYHTVPVRLKVFRIADCDGRRAYTRLSAKFKEVDGTPNGFSLDLTDGWGSCS